MLPLCWCCCFLLLNAHSGVFPVKLCVPFVFENQWRANKNELVFRGTFCTKKPFILAGEEEVSGKARWGDTKMAWSLMKLLSFCVSL